MRSIRRKILDGLRHGPMNSYDLATMLNEPPFLIRAELKTLKRARVVNELLSSERHVFELTTRGWSILFAEDQLEVGGPTSA